MLSPYLRSLVRGIRNRHILAKRGYFNYFGVKLFSSRKSYIFEKINRDAIFEKDVLEVIFKFLVPNTFLLDIGANIGAISVPVLTTRDDISVLSVECSPSTFPFLQKTHENSRFHSRWEIESRAIAMVEGVVEFHTSGPDFGAFDGLRDTGRGGTKESVAVHSAPLDKIWKDHGSPPVSVVKIDIEGCEYEAIMSGIELISENKPAIIFEWNAENLRAYGRRPETIFEILNKIPGELISVPSFHTITRGNLDLVMSKCEMFILVID